MGCCVWFRGCVLKLLHHCRCFSRATVEVVPPSPGLGIQTVPVPRRLSLVQSVLLLRVAHRDVGAVRALGGFWGSCATAAPCGNAGASPCVVGPTGNAGLLICLSVHMPGDGFADLLPDSWGTAHILPQLWGLALVQLQVPSHKREIQQVPFSVFAGKLQVMPNKFLATFSLGLFYCGSS